MSRFSGEWASGSAHLWKRVEMEFYFCENLVPDDERAGIIALAPWSWLEASAYVARACCDAESRRPFVLHGSPARHDRV